MVSFKSVRTSILLAVLLLLPTLSYAASPTLPSTGFNISSYVTVILSALGTLFGSVIVGIISYKLMLKGWSLLQRGLNLRG